MDIFYSNLEAYFISGHLNCSSLPPQPTPPLPGCVPHPHILYVCTPLESGIVAWVLSKEIGTRLEAAGNFVS
jgi:hypothetical protein